MLHKKEFIKEIKLIPSDIYIQHDHEDLRQSFEGSDTLEVYRNLIPSHYCVNSIVYWP